MKTVLSIKNLHYSYSKQKVLEDINLEVKERDFLVIIGANGGGKSTLLKLILGLLPLKEGEIKLYEKKIGYVPQNTNINNNFPIKVWEVVSLGYNPNESIKQRVKEVLKQVGLEGSFETKIGSLSGGQRQRVMIARALFSKPKLLLLDEPTSNIDPTASESIYKLLKELNQEITIVVVSHDISVILKYPTKIAYINKNIFMHQSPNLELNQDGHFCEVELMQMLEEYTCKSC
jgi:zinc transport system ATP-binding protein